MTFFFFIFSLAQEFLFLKMRIPYIFQKGNNSFSTDFTSSLLCFFFKFFHGKSQFPNSFSELPHLALDTCFYIVLYYIILFIILFILCTFLPQIEHKVLENLNYISKKFSEFPKNSNNNKNIQTLPKCNRECPVSQVTQCSRLENKYT